MKDCFGREISLGNTIAYAMNTHGLAFYKVTKLFERKLSGIKYYFDPKVENGYELSYRAVGLDDSSKMMIIDDSTLPINGNTPT